MEAKTETEKGYQKWLELKALRNLKKFPLVKGVENPKLRRIYPLMQKSVQQIMELLEEYPVSLIVFGSALTMKCNINSDLDLCIQTTAYDKELFYDLAKKIACMVDVRTDILYYNDLTKQDRIKEEIDRNGYWIQEAG